MKMISSSQIPQGECRLRAKCFVLFTAVSLGPRSPEHGARSVFADVMKMFSKGRRNSHHVGRRPRRDGSRGLTDVPRVLLVMSRGPRAQVLPVLSSSHRSWPIGPRSSVPALPRYGHRSLGLQSSSRPSHRPFGGSSDMRGYLICDLQPRAPEPRGF